MGFSMRVLRLLVELARVFVLTSCRIVLAKSGVQVGKAQNGIRFAERILDLPVEPPCVLVMTPRGIGIAQFVL
jgi:hypothetical protein